MQDGKLREMAVSLALIAYRYLLPALALLLCLMFWADCMNGNVIRMLAVGVLVVRLENALGWLTCCQRGAFWPVLVTVVLTGMLLGSSRLAPCPLPVSTQAVLIF
jgi:hypothetical protein